MYKYDRKKFIYLGLGSNLKNPSHNSIKKMLLNIPKRLNYAGLRVEKFSNFIISSPIPFTSGPNYINCVFKCIVVGKKSSTPEKLYSNIARIEKLLGKKKKKSNKARPIDIDILDFKGIILNDNLTLPHPRMHLRRFVLEPLENVDIGWEHPVLNKKLSYLKVKIKSPHKIIRKL